MDFGVVSPDTVTREFLAVVLAGFGNELVPLTSDHGEEPCPKALLPIANNPMLGYPLSWIEQSGVKNVLLICPSTHRAAISHYIHSDSSSTSFSSLRIDLQSYDESHDLSIGTCTLLRHFSNRITGDFILVPCDFITSPTLPLTRLLNKFRVNSTSDGAIATACWFEGQNLNLGKDAIPDEWGSSHSVVPMVWDESTETLLHICTPDDDDRNAEEIELRMALLSKYPRTKLTSKFQDSHVYVCRRSVLDALQRKPHMDSFREEFFPWLCRVQYQRTKRGKYEHVLDSNTNNLSQSIALRHSTLQPNMHDHVKNLTFSPTASPYLGNMALSGPPSATDSEDDDTASASLRIGVVLHRARDGYVARANNLQSFLALNRHFLADNTYSLPTDPKDRSLIDQKATISSDSMIGESTRIEEKTSIKKSVIGRHCVIGKMVKITGCVLMDHCIIADGAKLDGSMLGKNTKVGAKSELIRCITQAGYEVMSGESYRHEKLDVSDWTAAPEENEEENEDDEEDDMSESGEDSS
ncbi:hypothetical protein PILCRDRAFT_827152 [Piloderma croceum F 1598]|uniref:Translation initiation factor eIF2B subunit gamma n=1 Tax=Piloderma croceum (strain F 1598) TaxID=765440 RepID=A0A0C3F686_PILCF|nr:hypothetical protein PILCRDRAFT_827152 [Piloderma croceum F 1598]